MHSVVYSESKLDGLDEEPIDILAVRMFVRSLGGVTVDSGNIAWKLPYLSCLLVKFPAKLQETVRDCVGL